MSVIKLFLDEDVWLGLAAVLREHGNERSHNGIILSPQIEKGELVRRTLNLLLTLSAEEIANTVRHLTDYK